nr:hypothetical protein Iba_chr05eCG16610 [Ipomoea batatas]
MHPAANYRREEMRKKKRVHDRSCINFIMLMRPLLGLKPGTRPSWRAAGRIRLGVEDGNETAYETLLRSSRQNQIWG